MLISELNELNENLKFSEEEHNQMVRRLRLEFPSTNFFAPSSFNCVRTIYTKLFDNQEYDQEF